MCVIWGIPYLLIRVAVQEISPVMLVFARTTIGSLILMPRPVMGAAPFATSSTTRTRQALSASRDWDESSRRLRSRSWDSIAVR
jgi:hypothetical protein